MKNLSDFVKKHKKALGIIVLIVLIWLGATRIFGKKQTTSYQTAQVEKGTIVSSISASGQVLAAGDMPVTTQASGIIKNVFVKTGDTVQAGQNIIEISLDQQSLQKQTQAWSQYLSAKTSLNNATASQYSLQSSLFTKWKAYMDLAQSSAYQNSDGSPRTDQRALPQFLSTQDDWLYAEAQYKNQQNVVAQAQASLSSNWSSYQAYSPIITAPIGGTIANLTIVPGMLLSSSTNSTTGVANAQQIATINTNINPMAQVNLSEIDVTNVQVGQKATITLDAFPAKTYTGKVQGINKTGTITSGVTNYPAIITFDIQAPEVLPSMSATANIITQTKDNVLLVPNTSVQTLSGQTNVRVLNNNQIQQVPVQTGISSDNQTEIISGLQEGQTVVTSVTQSGSSSGSTSIFGGGGFRLGGGAVRPGGRD